MKRYKVSKTHSKPISTCSVNVVCVICEKIISCHKSYTIDTEEVKSNYSIPTAMVCSKACGQLFILRDIA